MANLNVAEKSVKKRCNVAEKRIKPTTKCTCLL